jgi:hypothetical protein
MYHTDRRISPFFWDHPEACGSCGGVMGEVLVYHVTPTPHFASATVWSDLPIIASQQTCHESATNYRRDGGASSELLELNRLGHLLRCTTGCLLSTRFRHPRPTYSTYSKYTHNKWPLAVFGVRPHPSLDVLDPPQSTTRHVAPTT